MSLDSTHRSSIPTKKNRPIAPPVSIGNEIRYSEIELSLYSEFSEDEDHDNTNHTLNQRSSVGSKNMFNQNIINKMAKFCHPEVRKAYEALGPFKIRPTDISPKMQSIQSDLEYRKSVIQFNKSEYY